jgi:cell division protein FtsI/penicillin-binding protein 2
MAEWTLRQWFRGIGRRQTVRLRRWLPAALALLAVFAVFAFGFALLTSGFPWVVSAIERWNDAYVIRRTGETSGWLFNQLVEERQIVFNKASGKLDLRIDCAVEQAGLGSSAAARKRLVDGLCDSDPGSAIQGELRIWNRNLSILAVRDDRRTAESDGEGCDNGKTTTFVIPEGCFPASWTIGLQKSQGEIALDARLREPPSAEVHGYLSRPARPGFGDWSQFDTAVIGSAMAVLQTRFAASSADRTITVDLIGEPESVQIDGQPIDVGRRLYCHGGLSDRSCREIVKRDGSVPHAWRLSIPVGRDRSVRVALRVRPLPVVPIVLSDLGTLEEDKRPVVRNAHFRADDTVRLTTNIALVCQTVGPEEFESGEVVRYIGGRAPGSASVKRYCEPAWNSSQVGGRTQFGTVQINLAGGDKVLPLTEIQRREPEKTAKAELPEAEEIVVPTPDAGRLGLLPVVGLGSADRYSLLGQAVRRSRADTPPEINLTIAPELQSIAHRRLSDIMSRKPGTEALTAGFVSGVEALRRGAVVLLDAGAAQGGDNGGGYDADAGRILAAATWPQLPAKPVHAWDALASDNYRPTSSPLAARAWSQNDKHYQPGSTFKPLIALAAIERAARGETTFLRALGLGKGENGGLTEQEIPSVFGKQYNFSYRSTELRISTGDSGAETHEISNAGVTALCYMVNGTSNCPRDGRIGLRGAITTSSNMFFARLALLVDEEHVVRRTADNRVVELKDVDPANPPQPLAIERLAARLVPPKRFDLMPGFTERFGVAPAAGSRTYATPIVLDAVRPDRPRRLTLALAGIGQATQATPLAMASIMASIGSGKIVRPRLTPEAAKLLSPLKDETSAGNEQTPAAAGDDLVDFDSRKNEQPIRPSAFLDLMSGLRSSLHNVVMSGTASGAFARSPLRPRVYGKTGTAQTGNDEASTNSVWFVGWIDGLGQGRWRDRRIAFACLVTHIAQEGDAAAGGKVCAPIIEQILGEYERTASRN